MSKLLDDLVGGGGGGGAVASVFGRTGVVLAVAGDYTASQIANNSTVPGATVQDALSALAAGAFSPGTYSGQPLVWNGTQYVASSGTLELNSSSGAARLTGSGAGLALKGSAATLTIQSQFAFSNHPLGFFGAAPVAQATPNSHANLVVALKNLGLIAAGSTVPIAAADISGNACSVLTRAANSAGVYGETALGADGTFLARFGGAIGAASLSAGFTLSGAGVLSMATPTVIAGSRGGMTRFYNEVQARWENRGGKQAAAYLTDANQTGLLYADGAATLPASTLTANRDKTMSNSGAAAGYCKSFWHFAQGFDTTYKAADGTTLITIAAGASVHLSLRHNGFQWALGGVEPLNPVEAL